MATRRKLLSAVPLAAVVLACVPATAMASGPTVLTEAATSVTQTSATLNATVNPNGGEVSDCKFEYGPTETYGTIVPCKAMPGSGTSPVAVSASISSLTPNTTYHFRISAMNAGGTSKGLDGMLTTGAE